VYKRQTLNILAKNRTVALEACLHWLQRHAYAPTGELEYIAPSIEVFELMGYGIPDSGDKAPINHAIASIPIRDI
jgi:hypothetical protein